MIVTCVPTDHRRASLGDRRCVAQLESSRASLGILLLYMHVYRKNLLPFLFFPKWLNLCRVQTCVFNSLELYIEIQLELHVVQFKITSNKHIEIHLNRK